MGGSGIVQLFGTKFFRRFFGGVCPIVFCFVCFGLVFCGRSCFLLRLSPVSSCLVLFSLFWSFLVFSSLFAAAGVKMLCMALFTIVLFVRVDRCTKTCLGSAQFFVHRPSRGCGNCAEWFINSTRIILFEELSEFGNLGPHNRRLRCGGFGRWHLRC